MRPNDVNLAEVIEYIQELSQKWQDHGLTDGKAAADVIVQSLKEKFSKEIMKRVASEIQTRSMRNLRDMAGYGLGPAPSKSNDEGYL